MLTICRHADHYPEMTPDQSAQREPNSISGLPVHELLALEAVSRLGSVQAAADALHVTPSGVSHRIASLERRMGATLLQRQGRGVVLTEVAEDYVSAVRPGLLELSSSTEALLEQEHGVVRIATAAAIGAAWLLPRLGAYLQTRPRDRFEVLTIGASDELPQDRWDLMVQYGQPARRGTLRRLLFTDRLIRVCAPALLARATKRDSAAASSRRPMAEVPTLRLTPLSLSGGAGKEVDLGSRLRSRLVFNDALAMLEAAAASAGVALTTEAAAAPYLADGRLVRADSASYEGGRYTMDLSESGRLKPVAASFYHWLAGHSA
jgi:LysR family glycine cleavage system transcriptional activator